LQHNNDSNKQLGAKVACHPERTTTKRTDVAPSKSQVGNRIPDRSSGKILLVERGGWERIDVLHVLPPGELSTPVGEPGVNQQDGMSMLFQQRK